MTTSLTALVSPFCSSARILLFVTSQKKSWLPFIHPILSLMCERCHPSFSSLLLLRSSILDSFNWFLSDVVSSTHRASQLIMNCRLSGLMGCLEISSSLTFSWLFSLMLAPGTTGSMDVGNQLSTLSSAWFLLNLFSSCPECSQQCCSYTSM